MLARERSIAHPAETIIMNNEYTSYDCNCSCSCSPCAHPSANSPAGQGTGFHIIVVWRPFVQGAIVGYIVVGGTLVRTEVLLLRTRLHVADTIPGTLAATIAGRAAASHLLHNAAVTSARTCRPIRPGRPLAATAR